MRRWRAAGVAAAAFLAALVVLALVLPFLAPDLAYRARDRAAEAVSGNRARKYRIALGAATGSSYRVGSVLNRYLRATAGYELELVSTRSPGNLDLLLDPGDRFDLATINSADEGAAKASGVVGVASLDEQYFFVIVPNDSIVREFRDLAGPVNPGVREPGEPPTLGERVLDYYELLSAPTGAPRVTVVRPQRGNVSDFVSGHMTAATRTQSLRSDLVENILRTGDYRLVPIRDHEALARSIPGAQPGFIPAGLYGPGRRIPSEPIATITVRQLLVARDDVPGRIVRDILESVYHPGFARDLQSDLTEDAGRHVGGLPLHPAADIFYRRNDLVTSDRLGRISFVASVFAALAASIQFASRYRRGERVRRRRRLLESEIARLESIRQRIEESPDGAMADALMRDADDLLWGAERDAAADLLDVQGIQALRSLHQVCWRSLDRRRATPANHIRA
jgi:TRAP-type uncharacterized transport system substrate-binding protein